MTIGKFRIHREGYKIIGGVFFTLIALNTAGWLIWQGPSIWHYAGLAATLLLLAFVVMFFRTPARPVEPDPLLIYAPADGKIVVIEETFEKEYFKDNRLQISIFMSPFNMHSNRYPISGTVTYTNYQPGKKFHARSPKSSVLNERSSIVVTSESGTGILVRQVAGAMARRIVTYSRNGEGVKQGDELGFIKFGSRVDIFLPTDTEVDVEMFQQVRASRTIIARVI
ncbi:MAG: phosphatidylserine decarboxylase family protein [Bacteroidales bacterium]|jgi:phosphatidylserine decarboxylase|nr:phosphatidylserine decarboxylase family protein [Bacteroidales bacterium]MCB9028016.1 phosphatidylserine decarboxylase family protein [Bacteroidales bacterium]MDD3737189.1 phosphatidylserine decarboxylase family protein [Bacteroidales bacterium]NLD62766.1 phosphatidylserine decarboxylase family protein [Bacteroidales bacterium]HNT92992.1 phosphatidylserine decarboxylase family protein [Bacteroidales bacterium]